ncbi:MAG: hypothetical protein ACRD4O_13390, partial [Bryobacteraceae bacterium]
MSLRLAVFLILALSCCAAAGSTAAQLAHEASQAEDEGHLVRAYLLYAEASADDPQNSSYREKRELLAPIAQLLTKATIENAPAASGAFAKPHALHGPPPLSHIWKSTSNPAPGLKGLPHLNARPAVHDFNLRGDTKTLFTQV